MNLRKRKYHQVTLSDIMNYNVVEKVERNVAGFHSLQQFVWFGNIFTFFGEFHQCQSHYQEQQTEAANTLSYAQTPDQYIAERMKRPNTLLFIEKAHKAYFTGRSASEGIYLADQAATDVDARDRVTYIDNVRSSEKLLSMFHEFDFDEIYKSLLNVFDIFVDGKPAGTYAEFITAAQHPDEYDLQMRHTKEIKEMLALFPFVFRKWYRDSTVAYIETFKRHMEDFDREQRPVKLISLLTALTAHVMDMEAFGAIYEHIFAINDKCVEPCEFIIYAGSAHSTEMSKSILGMMEHIWNFKYIFPNKILDFDAYYKSYVDITSDNECVFNTRYTTTILQFSDYRLENLKKMCSDGGFSEKETAFIDPIFLAIGRPSAEALAFMNEKYNDE